MPNHGPVRQEGEKDGPEVSGDPKDEATETYDWKRAMPRWMLVPALIAGFTWGGYELGQIRDWQSRDQKRIEQALSDLPTPYGARLEARVVRLEATYEQVLGVLSKQSEEMNELRVSNTNLRVKVEANTIAVNALTEVLRERRK